MNIRTNRLNELKVINAIDEWAAEVEKTNGYERLFVMLVWHKDIMKMVEEAKETENVALLKICCYEMQKLNDLIGTLEL